MAVWYWWGVGAVSSVEVVNTTRMAPPGTAIEFGPVVKKLGDVTAVNGVAFTVSAGEQVALLGPNGAGKSTTVDLLLGLRTPDSGTIRVFGREPGRAVAEGLVAAMLQTGALPTGARVREIVDLGRRLYGNVRSLAEVLELADLTAIAHQRADQLSGGQAQRVRFALALAGRPKLLFLDEPTAAMDVQTRQRFWYSVAQIAAEGTAVVFATHHLQEADQNADRVIILNHGRVIADGTPSQVKAVADTRTVRFTAGPWTVPQLRELPGVNAVEVHGEDVELTCADADATLAALYARSRLVRNISVSSAGLDEAMLALTTTS